MIEKEYYPLEEAAEILNCKVNDLIHLGARDKLGFYIVPSSASLMISSKIRETGLKVRTQSIREPLKIAKESISNLEAGQIDFPLLLCRSGGNYYADFFTTYLGEQNLGYADDDFESIFGHHSESSITGYCGLVGAHITSIELVTVSGEENITIKDAKLIILASDIQKLETQKTNQVVYGIEALESPDKQIIDCQQDYISNNLKILNDAAYKFWSNADPNQKDTHPTNQQVGDWLKEEGFSEASATQGAVIIRPKWAAKGRPSTK